MTVVKLAVIRQTGHRACPFGLPIAGACQHAGDSVYRMTPLDLVDKEDVEKYQNANKKVYLHHRTGQRCPFADKIVEEAPIVHCDFQDGGEGLRDSPMRASPYYPRVFNGLANNSGGGVAGLIAYPLNSYWENMEAQQLFSSMLTMYANDRDVKIDKTGADECADFYIDFFEKGRGG